MQSALSIEKGVLAYSAVEDKKNPSKITILETYASTEAYQAHIQTEHFKKYKTAVVDMVKQLELIDVVPIAIQSKPKYKDRQTREVHFQLPTILCLCQLLET